MSVALQTWLSPLLWGSPSWVVSGAGVAILAASALVWAAWRARRRLRTLGFVPGSDLPTGRVRDLLLLLALCSVALALAAPRIGRETLRVPTSGSDLVFLVDTSASMRARDLPPSRIARAKRALRSLLEGLAPGDRAALGVYAGQAVLLTPLTPDKDALAELALAIDSELFADRSSRLGEGILMGLRAFEAASSRPRTLVLFSDGEAQGSGVSAAIEAAQRAATRVVALGFGSEAGAPIPARTSQRGLRPGGRVLRLPGGEPARSRLHRERLAELARATRGHLLIADEWGELDLEAARRALAPPGFLPSEGTAGPAAASGSWLREIKSEWILPFAGIAFVLLWLELFASGALPPRLRFPVWIAARSALLMAIMLGGVLVFAGRVRGSEPAGPSGGANAYELMALGLADAESGDWKRARHRFANAALTSPDERVAALAYRNLGVSFLELEDVEAARGAFFDSLALVPEDREVQFNLEWTLARLRARDTPPPASTSPTRTLESNAVAPNLEEADEEQAAGSPESRADSAPKARAEQERPVPAADRAPTPKPSKDDLARWRDQVTDDPGRALRSAIPDPRARPRRGVPAW